MEKCLRHYTPVRHVMNGRTEVVKIYCFLCTLELYNFLKITVFWLVTPCGLDRIYKYNIVARTATI
jgi:hypothetical protein